MLRFEGRPRPPLVPPPVAGETLSGWVASLAGLYGLTVKGLNRPGFPGGSNL